MDITKYECRCGVVYDASTMQQVQRHYAAKIHQAWMQRRR